jgi:tRNA (guanosine-2'-O-)-methyltransferase
MRQLVGKPLVDFIRKMKRPPLDLIFVLQDVEDPVNVGAAFRIGDACGVEEIVLSGLSPVPPHPTIAGIGRGTHRRIPWSYTKYAADALVARKAQGYITYAIELASGAQSYDDVDYPNKVCLVVGNEHHGVTQRTLDACDHAIYLPMYGKIESLNVHVALGIAAYHILHRASLAGGSGATTGASPHEFHQ